MRQIIYVVGLIVSMQVLASDTISISQGVGQAEMANSFICEGHSYRRSPVGKVIANDGTIWEMPADVYFKQVEPVADLYNECNRYTPSNIEQVDINQVPIIDVDEEGEVVTAYLFADNYFELFINGQIIGVDPVPFTPFNSSVVRFRVNKPYDIAIRLVDWEENLAVGTETNRGQKSHPGDGGFIASFSDGTHTSGNWSAQAFYSAPLANPDCIKAKRNTSNCAVNTASNNKAYAAHWAVPQDWMQPDFNYQDWLKASVYTEEVVGVNNKKAYTNFRDVFTNAQFIWSANIVLDNEVLLRYRVE